MRRQIGTRTAKRGVHRAAGRAGTLRAIVALVALALALALGALPTAGALARLYHPRPPVASFGPLGGACAEGDLATGPGDVTSGSNEVTSVVTTCGAFEVGQELAGTGVSATITAVGAGTLTVSAAASASGSSVALAASSTFLEPTTVLALGQSAKRLYAVNPNLAKLFGFDLSAPGAYTPLGAPFPLPLEKTEKGRSVPQTTVAVDNSGGPTDGNVYTATQYSGQEIFGHDSGGSPLPGFPIISPPEPKGVQNGWQAVAVDPSGNVWGGNFKNGEVVAYEYSPAGVLLNTISLPGANNFQLESLAFAADGDLYADTEGNVWKLSAPVYDHPELFVNGRGQLDVDRVTGDVYLANQAVRRYSSDGTLLEEFATGMVAEGVAVDEASGAAYVSATLPGVHKSKIDVFEAVVLPELATAVVGGPTEATVTLNGSVDPGGVALTGCRFEWVTEAAFQASGFASLASGGQQACTPAFGSIPTSGQTGVSAAIVGLNATETYRYRLSASNVNGGNTSKGLPPSFALGRPVVETVGSPIRTAGTARLDSRVDPHGLATTYRFQYISDAAYQANLAASLPPFEGALETPSRSAGAGSSIELVSQPLEDLAAETTYHYRVLADNGFFGGPATGAEMTLTTRASDVALSHGRYPGPPGSDRAWEQVNMPDTSGNPVESVTGIASDGDSAVYRVAGGTPLSQTGTPYSSFLARRSPGVHPTAGWQTLAVYPSRAAAPFDAWRPPTSDDALSSLLAINFNAEADAPAAVWRLPTGGGAPVKLYEAGPGKYLGPYAFSDDGSRALLVLAGSAVDPEHHSPGGVIQLYDVSSGEPHMVSLLPGNAASPCRVEIGTGQRDVLARTTHWVSADGSHAFFPGSTGACTQYHLYVRDFGASETYRVDGPPLSGPDCRGYLIRSTSDAAFIYTQSRLAPEDTAVANCSLEGPGGDVYRYDLATHVFKCLTCVVPGGAPANVSATTTTLDPDSTSRSIAVAADGSRVYFTTETRLLPGTPETGTPAVYRVDTSDGSLAYVAPLAHGETVGENPTGQEAQGGSAVSSDGRFLAFASSSAALDALTASNNAHTTQYYVYDDASRSLLCASCVPDGAAPRASATKGGFVGGAEPSPNMTFLADNGDFAFTTPTPLVSADQNTAAASKNPAGGTDVYEWRDGRPLLISDGLTTWPEEDRPQVTAVSPSGRDIFFAEAAALTPDAVDGFTRVYDARIGGGIDFPAAPQPCPLEVCQGTPAAPPEESVPASSIFSGPANLTLSFPSVIPPITPKAKVPSRAELFARALKACSKKPKHKRARCVAEARKRFGVKKAHKATSEHGSAR